MGNNYIHEYAQILRDIFTSLEHRRLKNKAETMSKKEAQIFGIDPVYTAEAFLSIIFLLEDTSQAIDNYLEFGLDGPTKIKRNYGERYLRFYGILNSVYMQFISCRELYKMFKIPTVTNYNNKAKKLKVLKARNIGASHSCKYKNDDNEIDFYKVSQLTLDGYGRSVHIIGEKDKDYVYDIKDGIEKFNVFMSNELDIVANHILVKKFDANSLRFKEFSKRLRFLDSQVKGQFSKEKFDEMIKSMNKSKF